MTGPTSSHAASTAADGGSDEPVRDVIVLDAAAVRRLAERSQRSLALLDALLERGLWPALVPAVVVAECLTGDAAIDAPVEALLACCDIGTEIDLDVARRAAWLRTAAGRGSAADAIVVASAEPRGAVLTSGRRVDVEALALFADRVYVERC